MRGRDYEKGIKADYLQRLNELYEQWTEGFSLCPVLTVPADDLNYVLHDAHLDLIVSKIQSKLSGKEEVSFETEEIQGSRGFSCFPLLNPLQSDHGLPSTPQPITGSLRVKAR